MGKDTSGQLSFEDLSSYDIHDMNADLDFSVNESLPPGESLHPDELEAMALSFEEEDPFIDRDADEEEQLLNACQVFQEGRVRYLVTDDRRIEYGGGGNIITQRGHRCFMKEVDDIVHKCSEEIKTGIHGSEISLRFYRDYR